MSSKNNVNIRTIRNSNNHIMSASVEYQKNPISRSDQYTGERKSIRRENSASYIFRRGIYMLKDKSGRMSKHPYMVFQSDEDFINTVGILTVGITKMPETIDMSPIIDRGCLCFINPHRPYFFNIQDFDRQCEDGRFTNTFHSYLEDDTAFEILCDFWDKNGSGLRKPKSEFISNYLEYLYNFKEVLKTRLKDGSVKFIYDGDLKFKTSYDPDFVLIDSDDNRTDSKSIIKETDDCDINDSDDGYDDCDENDAVDVSDEYVEDAAEDPDKHTIEIDMLDPDVVYAIAEIEDKPQGEVTLPRRIQDMTIHEIKIFMAATNLYSNELDMVSLMFNCSVRTVQNKVKKIQEMYNIIFK